MCLEPRSSSWLGSWAVDPHSCARRCVVLGVTPGRDQGGAGSPEEARTWLGPGRAAGSQGHCCLSRPPVPALDWTSLRLGSLSEPEGGGRGARSMGLAGTIFQAVFSLPAWFLAQGELYFMSTGVPSAAAARGVVYKVIDPSR